ncbi:MAG TPA: tetratricopeptide repeat protein [Thermoanaerobaculia bacterium]|nr:tetratricopeptide repeat protein [Thermoanaerobaculia bacterium]
MTKRLVRSVYALTLAVSIAACDLPTSAERRGAIEWIDAAVHLLLDDGIRARPPHQERHVRLDRSEPEPKLSDESEEKLLLARRELDELRRSGNRDGSDWFSIGTRLLDLGVVDEAIPALENSIELLAHGSEAAKYNLACAYSLRGDVDKGLLWLERAIDAGYDKIERIENDSDLDLLRSDDRFAALARAAEALSIRRFLAEGERFGQFDEQWLEAAEIYRDFLLAKPDHGRAWFNLGYALHYSGRSSDAITAFEKALALGYRPGASMYNIACAYARLSDTERAFEWLEHAADAGFSLARFMPTDPDLQSLRSDPRFETLAQIGATAWA